MRACVEPECFGYVVNKKYVEHNELSCYLFKYPSGIKAIKVENSKGYFIIMPYNGQMVWDVVFNGRSLKMRCPYTDPRDVDDFIDTYGCFLMHCGALRMGCPGPEDTHALHGELPFAKYNDIQIIAGSDRGGDYLAVTGVYTYNRGFGDHYTAIPVTKLYAGSTVIDVSMTIENQSNYPMELMYMSHINFRAVDNGRIFQMASWDKSNMRIRNNMPSHYKVPEGFASFMKELEENPSISRVFEPGKQYYPEVIFYINNMRVDEDGWTHLMQIHPNGESDYLKYKPSELDHCVRWISRTLNQDGVGLSLPATCGTEGYTVEKTNGNVKELAPHKKFVINYVVGALDSNETRVLEDKNKEY